MTRNVPATCAIQLSGYTIKSARNAQGEEYGDGSDCNKGLNKKYLELDTVISELDLMRKEYGILDYQTQAERVTEGYMNALASGRSSSSEVQKSKFI